MSNNLKDIKGLDTIPIPDSFELKESNIKGAGLGIFAKIPLKDRTCLGAYKGEFISVSAFELFSPDDKIKGFEYGWELHDFRGNKDRPKGYRLKDQNVIGYIDGKDPNKSNYLRYINHPSSPNLENVVPYQLNDKIYYMTNRDIKAGEELYVNYGPQYFGH
jgi:SET domain-containing protein